MKKDPNPELFGRAVALALKDILNRCFNDTFRVAYCDHTTHLNQLQFGLVTDGLFQDNALMEKYQATINVTDTGQLVYAIREREGDLEQYDEAWDRYLLRITTSRLLDESHGEEKRGYVHIERSTRRLDTEYLEEQMHGFNNLTMMTLRASLESRHTEPNEILKMVPDVIFQALSDIIRALERICIRLTIAPGQAKRLTNLSVK